MKKIVLTLTAAMIFMWQASSFADTSSVDALIQKLEDKGILTDQDAAQLKGEIASKEKNSQETTFKNLLPDWLNSMKITGDFRLRDQYQRIDQPSGNPNSNRQGYNRVRIRARINFEDQINDKVKVVVGIATSGENSAGVGNPRSNNLTLGGNSSSEEAFNKSSVVLNKAYAVYTPTDYLTLEGGKMDNPIWEPIGGNAQLLWDPNITPEGGAVLLQKKINDYITPFSTSGIFILADNAPSNAVGGTETDPFVLFTQDGVKGNLTEKVYYKAAFSYYDFNNPNRFVFSNRPSATSSQTNNTNSTNGAGTQYTYSYNVAGGSVDLGINDPFGEMLPSPIYIPQIGIIGEIYQNLGAPSGQNLAWGYGGYIGSSQINGWGTWKLSEIFKVLERNSWLDILPDQDDYNGATDTAALRTQLDIGLAKNVSFTVTYYRAQVYKNIPYLGYTTSGAVNNAYSANGQENMFQADINFKF